MAVASARMLKPEALARFSSLELLAKTVVDGVLTGLHRSPHFGFSQEFAEYRAYNEGDDLRHVDWNVYARTDRTYVKRYRGDTNTSLMLVLDASASMGFGSTEVSKLDYARYLAASLAWLARKQHDAIGSIVFDDAIRVVLEASTKPDSLPRFIGMLEGLESASGTDLSQALANIHSMSAKRGLVAVISDFYGHPDEFLTSVQPLAQSGKDIAFFHIADPEEIAPVADKVVALRDLESGEELNVDPNYLQGAYKQRTLAHSEALKDLAARTGIDYTLVDTSAPLDEILHKYLLFRKRKL